MTPGIIQVYTGDGKGKTTAAIGLAVRAWGRGLRVAVFQFLKAPAGSGEERALAALDPPLPIYPLGQGELIVNRPATPVEITAARAGWERIAAALTSGSYDLLVIDELGPALNLGLLDLNAVLTVLKAKPEGLELVLTGRAMPQEVIGLADLVTELKSLKHPYDQGLPAREGIEF